MDIDIQGRRLTNLARINVLLGKNGSGKSQTLRFFDERKEQLPNFGSARYITPERGGSLTYQGNIETNLQQDPNWGDAIRRVNRSDNFRQISVVEFRRLETLVLRQIEKDRAKREDFNFNFDTVLAEINRLLDNVEVVRDENVGFRIRTKGHEQLRNADNLSSGETELITLAIEILTFAFRADARPTRTNYLFLDEPDVHLHPDLQQRLITLLVNAIANKNIVLILATHSTPILAAVAGNADARVGFMKAGTTSVTFQDIDTALKAILPVFGSHPLSNVFNEKPVLLVEGEDDERIWQQAVRSSAGRIKIWPLAVGDIQSLDRYENLTVKIAQAIYDRAHALSLRDRDESPYEIDDKEILLRARLNCRNAENLIVADDVLHFLGVTWELMHRQIENWLEHYPTHPQTPQMRLFKEQNYDRRNTDLKSLRNIFMMFAGSNKPWEVAVGQSIARLTSQHGMVGDNSLTNFLGPKLIDILNLRFHAG